MLIVIILDMVRLIWLVALPPLETIANINNGLSRAIMIICGLDAHAYDLWGASEARRYHGPCRCSALLAMLVI